MKKNAYCKIITLLLIAVLFVSEFPTNALRAKAAYNLTILNDGAPTSDILLEKNDKKELHAAGMPDGAKYSWQLLLTNTPGTWVTIADKNQANCDVTDALVSSMLDSQGKTAIRCCAVWQDKTYISDPVYITQGKDTAAEPVRQIPAAISNPVRKKVLAATEETNYVTITIHYQLNGKQVFADYIASLQYGTSFTAVVPSPGYPGYAPYQKGNDGTLVPAEQVELSFQELTDNQEIYVEYQPAESPYTARYFLQNISDDGYTENVSLFHKEWALTGTYPKNEIELNIDGFLSLFHEPDTVAADGSTEFHCYYDRNYYLYNFDNNGGFGTDPVYARYQTPLIIPTPTRVGYIFSGWDKLEADGTYDGVADSLPSVIELGNATYRAIWRAVNTTLTVVYWNENPDDPHYTYWDRREVSIDSGTVITKDSLDKLIPIRPTQTKITNEELSHYNFNQELTEEHMGSGITVAGDGSTVVNVYYSRKEYALRFIYGRKDRSNRFFVVGGSTYNFGNNKDYTGNDVQTLLNNVPSSYWGQVAEPELTEEAKNRGYTLGSVPLGNYTYYYLQFQAKYGASLMDLWPVGIFQPTKIQYASSNHNSQYAVFSAWNGEHHVRYSQVNSNQTIKGNYLRLDDEILYDSQYLNQYVQIDADGNYVTDRSGTDVVRFLAFWENGAPNIIWNFSRKWTYNIYMEPLPIQEESLKEDMQKYGISDYMAELKKRGSYDQTITENGVPTVLHWVWYNGKDELNLKHSASKQPNIYLLFDNYICCDNNAEDKFNEQTPPGTKGFELAAGQARTVSLTPQERNYYQSAHEANFFYRRTQYHLYLNNQGVNLTVNKDKVLFDEKANTYYARYGRFLTVKINEILNGKTDYIESDAEITPPYPDNLEQNAYYFGGWYTSPYFDEDSKVTNESTTLATDMTLYAQWLPVTHTVTFSSNYDKMIDKEYQKTLSINHQDYILTNDIPKPDSESLGSEAYDFIGWFYVDQQGNQRAFDPGNMPVVEDMNLFAMWRSSKIVTYTVHYVDEEGKPIAEDTIGYTYAGNTKTFTAKTGDALNPEFRTGYFPKVNSSSILATATGKNECTFEYVKRDSVSYTVQYLDNVTKLPLLNEKTYATANAVITEQFAYIPGFISDAFYKRLILTADDNQNVITFYYTKDQVNAYYAVKYMIEDLDGINYSEYAVIEHVGEIGKQVTAGILSITGFTYDMTMTKQHQQPERYVTVTETGVSTTLTAEKEDSAALILYVYYKRDSYQYDIQYLEYGSNKKLWSSNKIEAKYGETITHIAPTTQTSEGVTYTLLGESSKSVVLNQQPYTITFYYETKKTIITYIAVCKNSGATGFGSVTPLSEIAVSTSTISGSTPTANPGYKFVGWYCDADCTNPVPNEWIDTDHCLRPGQLYDNANVYYALFEPERATLTIRKELTENGGTATATDPTTSGSKPAEDTFLFSVTGKPGTRTQDIQLTVAIPGAGSVVVTELPVGDYTVTELGWSWRYEGVDEGGQSSTIREISVTAEENGHKNEVIFQNRDRQTTWLGGETYNENHFKDTLETP